MPGRNIVEIEAKKEIDGTQAFEASFAPTPVHELMLEMEVKRRGPPICVLTTEDGGKVEVHPNPLRGREGRYAAQVKSASRVTGIRVTTAHDIVARLVKVKLIGSSHAPAPGAGSAGVAQA
jgi:hypothetical protein